MKVKPSLSLAAATVFLACANPTAPSFATVVAEVIEVSSPAHGTTVKTELTVANATARTLYFNHCGTTIERHISGDTWQPVGGMLCLAIGYTNPFDGMVPIAASDYRRVTVHLTITQPIRNLDGTNRFRVRVQTVAEFPASWWGTTPVVDLASNSVSSNAFLLDIP